MSDFRFPFSVFRFPFFVFRCSLFVFRFPMSDVGGLFFDEQAKKWQKRKKQYTPLGFGICKIVNPALCFGARKGNFQNHTANQIKNS